MSDKEPIPPLPTPRHDVIDDLPRGIESFFFECFSEAFRTLTEVEQRALLARRDSVRWLQEDRAIAHLRRKMNHLMAPVYPAIDQYQLPDSWLQEAVHLRLGPKTPANGTSGGHTAAALTADRPRRTPHWVTFLQALTVVLAMTSIGFWASTWAPRVTTVTTPIDRLIEQISTPIAAYPVSDRTLAQRFIFDRTANAVQIPTVHGYNLQGISMLSHQSVSFPVLIFRSPIDPEKVLRLSIVPFRQLGRLNWDLPSDLQGILEPQAQSSFQSYQHGDHAALFWRDRDDLFVATGTAPIAALPGLLTR